MTTPTTSIYMDGHATTPVDPRVFEAMRPFFLERIGNASSVDHAYGRGVRDAVEQARAEVAALIGASPKDIIFTSGATEANNLAIQGVAASPRARGRHIVTAATEHPAVLDVCRRLEAGGAELTILAVDRDGLLDPARVEAAIRSDTILISIMAANNEIGVLQPIDAIARIARARGVPFHTDAAQAAGRIPVHVEDAALDLVSISAHKMYGPQGVGALYVRSRRPAVRIEPLFAGGGHERGLRPGTLNAPGIVGLGAAAAIARMEMAGEARRLADMRDALLRQLREAIAGVSVNGSLERRLPGNLNVSIEGADETLAASIEGLAVSSGSACATGGIRPSHVLRALGVAPAAAHGALRFGLTRFNREHEIPLAVARVAAAVERIRASKSGAGPVECRKDLT